MPIVRRVPAIALVVVAAAAPAPAQIVAHTFDAPGHTWWALADSGKTDDPAWKNVGGNPGGYIMHHEFGGSWWFIAPADFLGDRSFAFGGSLSMDLRTIGGVIVNDLPADIIIEGGGGVTIRQNVTAANYPTSQWKHYAFPLDASGLWWNVNAGRNATDEEILQALSNVATLRIRGDWMSGGPDRCSLDNVVLAAAPCPADLNADGVVAFEDINIVLTNFASPAPAGGDADADGDVDFQDLNIVLSAYASSC